MTLGIDHRTLESKSVILQIPEGAGGGAHTWHDLEVCWLSAWVNAGPVMTEDWLGSCLCQAMPWRALPSWLCLHDAADPVLNVEVAV